MDISDNNAVTYLVYGCWCHQVQVSSDTGVIFGVISGIIFGVILGAIFSVIMGSLCHPWCYLMQESSLVSSRGSLCYPWCHPMQVSSLMSSEGPLCNHSYHPRCPTPMCPVLYCTILFVCLFVCIVQYCTVEHEYELLWALVCISLNKGILSTISNYVLLIFP